MLRRIALLPLVTLAALPLGGCLLDFSPDGKQIVFCVNGRTGQPVRAAVVGLDGSGFRTLLEAENAGLVSWSPDGASVLTVEGAALVARQQGTPANGRVWLHDTASGKSEKLGMTAVSTAIGWRDDSKRFILVRDLGADTFELDQYSLPDRGTTLRVQLPTRVSPAPGHPIVWLPGSDDCAFVGESPDGADVYTVEAGELKRVTTSHDVIGLGLAADGKALVWARKGPDLRYILLSVYRYDLKSRSVARLPLPDRVQAINPSPRKAPTLADWVVFSPDGSRMALRTVWGAAQVDPSKPAPTENWYTVTMDGKQARALGPSHPAPVGPPAMVVRWSRDGKQIAALSQRNDTEALRLYQADGTPLRTVWAGSVK